jgi:hypothetical protein
MSATPVRTPSMWNTNEKISNSAAKKLGVEMNANDTPLLTWSNRARGR